jgi:preprotein translocase subunit SecF
MINIIQSRKIWLSVSSILLASSIAVLFIFGFNYGIDFTGGSLMELKFSKIRPTVVEIQDSIKSLELGDLTVQPVGEDKIILRFKEIKEEKHKEIFANLQKLAASKAGVKANDKADNLVEEQRFDTIGPSVGQELKIRSIYAIFFVLLAILIFIAWAFRNASKPVASWKYGMAALIAMFHDVMIVLGVFAILGKFMDFQINTPFVAAVLTVLGYSVNDTIVVFDRIRENLPKSDLDFEGTVNVSLNQTLVRSLNTSMTVLLVLLAILFFGGASIRDFVLALSIGIFVGTYSSIFIAPPILVMWEKLSKK